MPKQNEQDLDEIPEEIKELLEFYPVECAGEVLQFALNLKLSNHQVSQHVKPEINHHLN